MVHRNALSSSYLIWHKVHCHSVTSLMTTTITLR